MLSLSFKLESLAVPGVLFLIGFLAYSSQHLFQFLEPEPLPRTESRVFNGLVASLLICYARACAVDPGSAPRSDQSLNVSADEGTQGSSHWRWCKKCEAPKPPRAHHCKICKRCTLKMDHHCPWIANCLGHRNFQHFFRFLSFSVVAMTYLQYFLYQRVAELWDQRGLASYLGPSALHLSHLLLLCVVNSITLFMLFVLLVRTTWNLVLNMTSIETWEIERHEALVRRARKNGGYVNAPGGQQLKIVKHEFPYDIGIWQNLTQGMGTQNVLSWFWPFARSPSIDSGLGFEENDFNDGGLSWPPPDPDRMPLVSNSSLQPSLISPETQGFSENEIKDFRNRQAVDLQRFENHNAFANQRRPIISRSARQQNDGSEQPAIIETWTNSEGEKLDDYGVDEDAEEDAMPLSELIAHRRAAAQRRNDVAKDR